MTEFKIEKNVPMPKGAIKGRTKWGPWRELKVGESYLLPCEKIAHNMVQSRVLQSCRLERSGIKLATRTCPEGVRVWRIK